MRTFLLSAAFLFVLDASALSAPTYTLTKTVALGAPDGWDYVVFDPASNLVFVGHSTEVTVVDGKSGTIVGHLQGLHGAHGTAVVPALKVAFADSGRNPGSVTAYDLQKYEALPGVIATPEDTDAMLYDPASNHVFTMNGDSGNASVIDPQKRALVANLALDGKPEYGGSDGRGRVYINLADKGQLAVVDSKANTVIAHWTLPDCVSPHGLAVDAAGRRVFSSCANGKLIVTNADTGANVATLPIGLGTDAAAFDPTRQIVFSSNGSGTLSVIQQETPDKYATPIEVATTRGARTMAVDPKTGRLFLVAADYTEDPSIPVNDRGHFKVVPGTARLMFYDPH
jgi:DNA-binding beta-propeller fold protein YncE